MNEENKPLENTNAPQTENTDVSALKNEINELKAMLSALKSSKEPDVITKSEKITDDEAQKKSNDELLSSAVKFNLGLESFIEENIKLLPENTKNLYKILNETDYSSEIEKQKSFKAKMIDNFFKYDSNINIIKNEEEKRSILEFKKLSNTDKLNEASKYWNILKNTLILKGYEEKAKQVMLGNNGLLDGESSVAKYNNKFFEAGKNQFRK